MRRYRTLGGPRPGWPRRSVPAEPWRQFDVEGVEVDVAAAVSAASLLASGRAGAREWHAPHDAVFSPIPSGCEGRGHGLAHLRGRGADGRGDGPGDALGERPAPPSALVDISLTGPLLSSRMSDIAQAIADRQSEIDRLQAEIKALTDVDQILGASAPPSPRSTSRRSSSTRKPAAAAAAESKSDAKPERKRRPMTAAEKQAVSERMTTYWAKRRKQAAKK